MRHTILAAIVFAMLTATLGTASAGPNCTKGKPCGNSCISKDKVCHKP
jgi:hypothetical protein